MYGKHFDCRKYFRKYPEHVFRYNERFLKIQKKTLELSNYIKLLCKLKGYFNLTGTSKYAINSSIALCGPPVPLERI